MPQETKDIANEVMDKIRGGKLKMRPKIYFIVGSISLFVGLVLSVLISVFMIGLIRFSLRPPIPICEYQLSKILSLFPWWLAVVAIAGLISGALLLRQYDFMYKIKTVWVVVGFVVSIIIAGWMVDVIGVNDSFSKHGYMKQVYRQKNRSEMFKNVPRPPNCRNRIK